MELAIFNLLALGNAYNVATCACTAPKMVHALNAVPLTPSIKAIAIPPPQQKKIIAQLSARVD